MINAVQDYYGIIWKSVSQKEGTKIMTAFYKCLEYISTEILCNRGRLIRKNPFDANMFPSLKNETNIEIQQPRKQRHTGSL